MILTGNQGFNFMTNFSDEKIHSKINLFFLPMEKESSNMVKIARNCFYASLICL